MAQGQGPFSSYLTETFKPQATQPTGFETTPVAIAAIGSKFLDGLRQARLQKAAMAEQENEKIQRAHEQAIEFAQKQQGVDPSVIQRNVNRLTQSYLAHIAGQKESSKDTGHPMTDMVKNIATNLIGGQLPKKGAPLDPGLIGQVFSELNDPANRTDNMLARLNSDFATALKTGNVADIRTATAHPEYSKIVAEGRRLTGKQDWQPDIFQSLAADPIAATMERVQKSRIEQRFGGNPSQAQPTGTQPPPRNIFQDIEQDKSNEAIDKSLKLPTEGVVIPELGTPRPFVGADKKTFMGVFNSAQYRGHAPGPYDIFGVHRPDAVQASPVNPATSQKIIESKAAPDQPTQLLNLDVLNGKITPLIGPDGKPVYKFAQPSVNVLENQAEDGSITNSIVLTPRERMPAPAPRVTATPPPPVARATTPPATIQQPQTPRAAAPSQPPAASGPSQYAAPRSPGGAVKRASLVPEPEIVQSLSDDLADGVSSLESLSKEYKDKFAQKAILGKLRQEGHRPLTQKNVDRINAISSVANEFVPAYERMIGLLSKEKNPQLQYINGKIVNAFTDPELNAAKEQINSMITNLAKTIGGEVRGVTDADAKRVLGYGPQVGYTVALNQKLINRFKHTLANTLTSDVSGLSEAQLLRIGKRRGGVIDAIIQDHLKTKAKPTGDKPQAVKLKAGAPGFRPDSSAPVPTTRPKITVKPI